MMIGGGMGMMATGMMGGMRSNYGGDGSYMVRIPCGMRLVVLTPVFEQSFTPMQCCWRPVRTMFG